MLDDSDEEDAVDDIEQQEQQEAQPVEVEAESWEEAITKVESNSVPLPTDPNYVDASLEVDMEIIEEEMENPNTFDLVD